MPQFLIDGSLVKNGSVILTGADAKHISTVLRLKAGDWIMLTDGKGGRFKAKIVISTPKQVEAKIVEDKSVATGKTLADMTLAIAIIKHDKFEWIIQKAVELGCSKFIPFTSERTIPKLADASKKLKRWQKIADEAAKQCGTAIRPMIHTPVPFAGLFDATCDITQKILFFEGEAMQDLKTSTLKHSNTLIIIGPEGGFAPGEVKAALEAGATSCSLGPLILRVETAAIAGLTLVQNKLGYFDL